MRRRLTGAALAVAISVIAIWGAATAFTTSEKATITALKARIAALERTVAGQQDALEHVSGDLVTLGGNDATLAADVGLLDRSLADLVADDGPLAQLDRNVISVREYVEERLPPIAISDVQSLVNCSATTCTVDVAWRSDPPATGQVEWGTTTAYGNLTAKEPTLLAYHRQRIGTFPNDGREFHYRIVAETP